MPSMGWHRRRPAGPLPTPGAHLPGHELPAAAREYGDHGVGFIYPALFHLRLCAAASVRAQAVDSALLVAGVAVMLFTLAQALSF